MTEHRLKRHVSHHACRYTHRNSEGMTDRRYWSAKIVIIGYDEDDQPVNEYRPGTFMGRLYELYHSRDRVEAYAQNLLERGAKSISVWYIDNETGRIFDNKNFSL